MSFIERFLGRKASPAEPVALVANPGIDQPLNLQALFAEPLRLDSAGLTRSLRAFDRSLAQARAEIDTESGDQAAAIVGLVGWGRHVVRILGFSAPMPGAAVELCIAPAHYSKEIKQRARAHQAHAILYYGGYDGSPFEQYVALATVAGALANHGAFVVLNETARTSLPADVVAGVGANIDAVRVLRELPFPYLYCGFVKLEIEGERGVWMRTYGAAKLGLPDFAARAAGHHEGQRYFDFFDHIFGYLLQSGRRLARGDTMQVGGNEFMRVRAPKLSESFLERQGELFVIDVIGPDEINC